MKSMKERGKNLKSSERKFPFPKEINNINYFRFDKEIIKNLAWAQLPKASKSIFPVIAIHSNAQGLSWPSQETIGALSGCTPKTVREGVEGLEESLLEFKKMGKVTARGQLSYKYQICIPTIEPGISFNFYRAFIDGGNWRLLSSVSKAAYPVIRSFSYFDPSIYCDLCYDLEDHKHTGLDYNTFIIDGYYKEREFDLSIADNSIVAEYAGISTKSLEKVFNELVEMGFIEWEGPYWKVFRLPPFSYKRDYLMSLIDKSEF